MSCYQCDKEPKYTCKTCGGLVCEDHGSRIDSNNICLCTKCPQAGVSVTANLLVAYLDVLFRLYDREDATLSGDLRNKIGRVRDTDLLSDLRELL